MSYNIKAGPTCATAAVRRILQNPSFGCWRSLESLDAFPLVKNLFETALSFVLITFAFLSFRDAFRFRRTQKAKDVSLQLPNMIKKRIHVVLRHGVKSHHLLLGGAGTGVIVTALETVCTGQVYVPAMTIVIREAGQKGVFAAGVWARLLLYNFMFILPLVVATVCTSTGINVYQMLSLSRKNVVFAKILLGTFFLAMTVYLNLSRL